MGFPAGRKEWLAIDSGTERAVAQDDLTPEDFAQVMGNAAAVLTNFFHGCIFALLNGKPWAAAPSDYRAIKIPDLATVVGAQHRVVDSQTCGHTFTELLDNPIGDAVATRLVELRQRSETYLNAALS